MPARRRPAPPPTEESPSPKVDYVRPEVADMLPKWLKIMHVLGGSDAVKGQRTAYLVRHNASDTSPEADAYYEARLKRAVFYPVTGRTHKALVGEVFAEDPAATLPPTLEPFINDVDGSGLPMDLQSKQALSHVLAFGRAGLLVDYPTTAVPQTPDVEEATPTPTTRADLLAGNVRPTMILYRPEQVINWRTKSVGSKTLLSLVVLSETYLADDDGFEPTYKPQMRVLRLNEANQYTVEIYQKVDGVWKSNGPVVVMGSNGAPLQEITFIFIGSEDNTPEIDEPPMLDMAELNLAHYNNSADQEDSITNVGQPMYWFGGLTQTWVDKNFAGGLQIGSRKAVLLPDKGNAGILQPEPNTLAKDGMVHKEEQLKAIGARLVTPGGVQQTATEDNNDKRSEMSVLMSCAHNVSLAYTQGLRFAAMFVGENNVSDEALAYELNRDLTISTLTPEAQKQIIGGWQSGAYDWEEMRWNLRKGGIVYKPDDEAKENIAAELPSMPVMPGTVKEETPPGGEEEEEEEEEETPPTE